MILLALSLLLCFGAFGRAKAAAPAFAAGTERRSLVPVGKAVGIKLFSDGVMVVGLAESTAGGPSPAAQAGLAEGDRILAINGQDMKGLDENDTPYVTNAISAYQEGSHRILMFRKVAISQLLLKALGKAFLYRKCIVLRTLILGIVIRSEPVTRDRIVLLILRQRDFPRSFILFLFTRKIFIQNRILLQLLSDSLFEFLNRELDQLDGLDLQRRKLLGLFEF